VLSVSILTLLPVAVSTSTSEVLPKPLRPVLELVSVPVVLSLELLLRFVLELLLSLPVGLVTSLSVSSVAFVLLLPVEDVLPDKSSV
jgi:hypothetical protein